MASERVTIFTNAMRTEFLTSFEAVAEPTPIDKITQTISSTQRFEHYTWMSPVPGLNRWAGHRRFGQVGDITYKVPNIEYDAAFEVPLRDIEDDQVGGYKGKSAELADFARVLPNQLVLQHMADGTTNTCFDGSAFFASSHTIGTGNNLIAATVAASDSKKHKMVVAVHNKRLKPFIYQDRKPPKFDTDAETAQSSMSKMVRYWIDMEGAAAYGWWWDAILVTFAHTPTLTEVQTALGQVEARFKTFYLPENMSGDQPQYLHTQLVHSPANTTIIGSPNMSNLLRQVMEQQAILNSGTAITNIYYGWANVGINPYFAWDA